jgi:hypothetical protein
VQCLVYAFGNFATNSINLCNVVNARCHQALQAAKAGKQFLPPLCPDATDFFER